MQLQDAPPTFDDERMHVMNETCWCGPTVEQVAPRKCCPKHSEIDSVVHHKK